METELIKSLVREGRLLAAAAVEAGPGARVPTCPGWQVRDVLRHTGMVHRWATAFITEGYVRFHPADELSELDGDELVEWFRDGHGLLVAALSEAPADVECWTFLPAPSPLAFWARRQAHEPTIHRTDAESARGTRAEGIGADLAADGIDELRTGFHGRSRSNLRTDRPRVLRVRTTDTGDTWTVRLSSEPPATERGATADADCELSGPAAELYPALWNRLPVPHVSGDPALAVWWREHSAIV
jgi:uncharacterized protein (TIGR03083 family)